MSDHMSARTIAVKRDMYLIPVYHTYYKDPIHLVKGEMQYLYDDGGRKYLDAFASAMTISVGHCHPDVVPEIQKQTATLQNATTMYYGEPIVKLAEKITEVAPGKLQRSFFTNSASEATEFAAAIAKHYTKRHEFISMRHSFHGRTLMAMSLCGQSIWRHSVPYVFGVTHVPAPYCYRCPMGLAYPSCGIRCAHEVHEAITYSTSGRIAGMIAEPILGFGGVITPPKEYFPIVAEIVREHGGLLIIDEAQTGFGRTGGKWFGIEHTGVDPDIMTMANGMGNGIPIGGVITTAEIAEAHRGLIQFSAFGGNPVSMSQARLVIDTIQNRNYLEHVRDMGEHLRCGLKELQEKHRLIGDVRGTGLMFGVELVKDRSTKEAASDAADLLMDLCKERGILLGKGAMAGNVIRVTPPYCITQDDIDHICKSMDESLALMEKE